MLNQPLLKKRKVAEDEQDSEMADVTEKDEKGKEIMERATGLKNIGKDLKR